MRLVGSLSQASKQQLQLFRISFDVIFAHNVAQIRQFSLAPRASRHFDEYRVLAQYVHSNLTCSTCSPAVLLKISMRSMKTTTKSESVAKGFTMPSAGLALAKLVQGMALTSIP